MLYTDPDSKQHSLRLLTETPCIILPFAVQKARPQQIGHRLRTDQDIGAGARCTATLLHEMNKRGKSARFGIVSMCIGSGMGAAAVFERGGEVDHVKNARKVNTQDYLSRDAAV